MLDSLNQFELKEGPNAIEVDLLIVNEKSGFFFLGIRNKIPTLSSLFYFDFHSYTQCWKNPGEFKSESIFPAKY